MKAIKLTSTFILLFVAYYLIPIENSKNIAPNKMLTSYTLSPTYQKWRNLHDALHKGHCFKALYLATDDLNSEASQYWVSRMFELGVCLPQSNDYALLFEFRNMEYGTDAKYLRLGYYIETGVGMEASIEEAKEMYLYALEKHTHKPTAYNYSFISEKMNYVFSGNHGSPVFADAFEIYIEKAPPPNPFITYKDKRLILR